MYPNQTIPRMPLSRPPEMAGQVTVCSLLFPVFAGESCFILNFAAVGKIRPFWRDGNAFGKQFVEPNDSACSN